MKFQFHLVRLKAAGCEGGRREAEFQFHLVRLKVDAGANYAVLDYDFNSI